MCMKKIILKLFIWFRYSTLKTAKHETPLNYSDDIIPGNYKDFSLFAGLAEKATAHWDCLKKSSL